MFAIPVAEAAVDGEVEGDVTPPPGEQGRPHSASRPRCASPSSGTAIPPLNDAPALILPRLKHLELVVVCLSKGDMERLLHGYTTLEYLHLQAINGLSSFHITSMTMCVAGVARRHHKMCITVWSLRTHLHLIDYL